MNRSRTTAWALVALTLVLIAGASNAGSAVLDRDPRNTHDETPGPTISSAFPSFGFISNGTLRLGITPQGYIDATSGTENVGLVYLPTGGDALIPGCWCEGWGLADTAAAISGWASGDSSNGGISANASVVSFDVTADSAESIVEIAGRLRVRHFYHPSPRPELYQVDLRVENIGTSTASLVYRRAMDWDVPPTEFDEFVTLQGTHPLLLDSTDDGFAHVDPLRPLTDLGARGTFTDVGPDDRGGAFDLSLGTLAPGASTTLTMFYGAASNETDALAALAAVGASIYSLGQPNTPDGPTLGTPNTFMFGIPGGGTPPPGGPPPRGQTFGVGEDGVATHGKCGCRLFADPVNSVSGAFATKVEDLSLPGTGVSLDWTRSYTSADPTVGRLGPGWTDSLSASLAVQANGDVVLHGEDGQQLVYTLQGDGSFAGAPGSLSTLRSVTGGYELVRTDQVVYRFDSQGRLLTMKDRNDQGLALAYDGSGRLVTIMDAAGRQTSVSYNASNLVSQVSTQDGRSVSYGYTSGRLTSITDVRGKTWTYTYDADGRLAAIRDPLSHTQVANVYGADGRVSSQTDALGKQTTFAWDAATEVATATDANGKAWKHDYDDGVIAKEIDPLNNATQLAHDGDLNESAVTGPTGEQTTLTYDAAGNLLTATAPPSLGSVQKTFSYNARNDPTEVTDARGKATSYTYDASGNVATVTQDGIQVASYTYDPAGRVSTFTDGRGKTTTYAYDGNGNVASVADPLGNRTTYTYDGAGRVLTRVDPKGNVQGANPANFRWTYTYDAAGNLLTETDPLGGTTTNAYDDAGRLQSTTDAKGRTTTNAYDDANRLLTETGSDPDGGGPQTPPVTQYTYDDVGNKLTETDPRGNTTTFAYDGANRLIRETGPDPDGGGPLAAPVTTYTYDENGNLASVVEPRGNEQGGNLNDYRTTYTYDAAGRLLTTTDPLGNVNVNTYDPVGNLASVRDANDHTTSYTYDAAGRILTVTAPDGGVTSYTYDAAGNLVTRTDALNHTTIHAYDDSGRLIRETGPDPDGPGPGGPAISSYAYDANGNRLTLTDPNGNATPTAGDGVTSYGYDRANRLTSIDYSDSTPDVAFTYDAVGNRLTMTDGAGTETRMYDGLDRLLSVTRGANAFLYEYDAAGNITKRAYPGGTVSDYIYDPLNRLRAVSSSGRVTSYAYDVASNLTQTTLPTDNGHVETRTYDRAGRLTELVSKSQETIFATDAFTITLDGVGNPLQVVRTRGLDQTRQNYTYDANDRILAVCFQSGTCPGASDPFIRWAYDKVGNRLSEQRPSGTTTYIYDARDRLLASGSTTYAYDQNGNEVAAGGRTFTYDLANRLKATTEGSTTTTYMYDGEGLRLHASSGSQASKKTNFLWDVNGSVPEVGVERDGNGNPTRRYLYGVRRVSQTAGNNTSYFIYDGLGSVTTVLSSSHGSQWTYEYEPFGSIRSETKDAGNAPDNFMKFTGEYLDPTGLYHLRARQYDPQVGRFLRADPADQTVNESAISAYAYVANTPTVFVDPSGEVLTTSNRGEVTARVASSLAIGVSASPAGVSYRRADGCARRVSGTSGYERYSVSFPTARLLPFPFHAGLSIDAFPVTCRGNRWTVHWWTRVDTSALTGPFGDFRLITVAAIRGTAGGWRTLGTLEWKGALNPSRDYWETYRERYSFISVNPPRQFDEGRLVLAVRLDREQGIFPALVPRLQKTVEFPLLRR